MTHLPSAWIAALCMLSAMAVVVYLVVRRELRPWRRFVRALQTGLGARISAIGLFEFERSGRSCQLTLHLNKNGPARFRLAVSAHVAATMTLHLRGTGDDLAASLGLAVPRNMGHPIAARNWMVDAADTDAPARLLADAAVRGQIEALLRAGVATIAWSEASQAVFLSSPCRREVAGDIQTLDLALALALASSAPRPKGAWQALARVVWL